MLNALSEFLNARALPILVCLERFFRPYSAVCHRNYLALLKCGRYNWRYF